MAQIGTIAITDYDWYRFLSHRRYWEEVNFWTPSARVGFRASEFSPFFFKLRAPWNSIVGFGYFARYSVMPDWLAWDCFGQGNGCRTFEEMRARLVRLRRGFRYTGEDLVPTIGCLVIVDAVFFGEDEWVSQPADWRVRTQRNKRYDLSTGEGARIWTECLQRARAARLSSQASGTHLQVAEGPPPRYGNPTTFRPRLGQGAFRVAVMEAYRRACAVTKEHSLPALEAAHIKPFANEGRHEVRNGLFLRADLHRLFERGYVTVTTDHVLEVSSRLRSDFENGRSYYPLHGRRIALPRNRRDWPDPQYLAWHNENVYLG